MTKGHSQIVTDSQEKVDSLREDGDGSGLLREQVPEAHTLLGLASRPGSGQVEDRGLRTRDED